MTETLALRPCVEEVGKLVDLPVDFDQRLSGGDGYSRPMLTQQDKAERFLALHQGDQPLLLPNPWDEGSAKLLASLGFSALATTSGGFAATLGRVDGTVTREEALAHAARLVAATDLPVSADLENGFADDPAGVVETIEGARSAGLAGCSVEDFTRDPDAPIYDLDRAVERKKYGLKKARKRPQFSKR